MATLSLDNGLHYLDVDSLTDDQVQQAEAHLAAADDELREQAHGELAPCVPREIVARYAELHAAKYGQPWVTG